MNNFIISGGPGSGKTTLVDALSHNGVFTYKEVPRQLIEEQSRLTDGVLPWAQLEAFAKLCLNKMIAQRECALRDDEIAIFDRAIPDICGYLELGGIKITEHLKQEAMKGYQKQVFFCKPDLSIYVSDEVRPYPFEKAMEIHCALHHVYQQLGYQIIEVPLFNVTERSKFVLNTIRALNVEKSTILAGSIN